MVGVGRWRAARSLLGLLVIVVGVRQSTPLVGPFHWVIQVVHLLLGILAIGLARSLQHVGGKSRAMREAHTSTVM